MRRKTYRSVVRLNDEGSIQQAACDCPAGKGIDGLGKCNHTTALLFALEDFSRKGLKQQAEPVSCTSELCRWTKPRTLQVSSEPVQSLTIRKYQYGQDYTKKTSINLYDPRAQHQRSLDQESVHTLCDTFKEAGISSSLFLFHDISAMPDRLSVPSSMITEEPGYEIPCCDDDVQIIENSPEVCSLPFNDDYNIDSHVFHEIVDYVAARNARTCTSEYIQEIEKQTRGQADNSSWQEIRRTKMTASNFGKFMKRRADPDKLLNSIMYKPAVTTFALEYGRTNEENAVNSYLTLKKEQGKSNIKVLEVGLMLSSDNPDYGASLDRVVVDPTEADPSEARGGLEVKCPSSLQGMTAENAAQQKRSCLEISNGIVKLKEPHDYYIQVQAQMYVSGLPWVDFVVWFGKDCDLFVQRIKFNREAWYSKILPAVNHFYRRAFLPEILTGRVKRGVQLYRHGGWKPFVRK
ncbi:uncharacterized protein [Ptychodera flava]|uniref:uncharacterized protein n=1 Tax=Ptychodera flava TaxID=63121 RepID=UPI00396A29E0